ncbi:MAG: glycine betaine/L-proline ABC transporter ATP-binding protein [Oligoflexales bacterium]|nr:glycine betaine/L-proline ABC transporter ATP-binding protein [Oligoflexales bacterium]
MDPIISLEGVSKIFGKQEQAVYERYRSNLDRQEIFDSTQHTLALKHVSFKVKKGDIFVIMGLSGCGKSTLIRHLNLLIQPTAGQVLIDGIDLSTLSNRELQDFRRHKISMVFQNFCLLPHKTILNNVALGLKAQGMAKKEYLSEAGKWIELVGLKGYEHSFPNQLSGGMQQRVGLARALATNPDILLMDEAFSALDPLIKREMQDQLLQLQKELKKTIIFITHDLDEALRLGDQIAILKAGELIQVGTPQEILLNPSCDYVRTFVKDVNRYHILTARSLLQQTDPIELSEGTSPQKIKHAVESYPFKTIYFVNQNREFIGGVDKDFFKGTEESFFDHRSLQDKLQLGPSILIDTPLESILPDMFHSSSPLPVLDKKKHFHGVVSEKRVIEALGN